MASDRCEELLVGIVSGDLGEAQERAAREEVERCAEHAASLRNIDVGTRLAGFLTSVEPSPELDRAILAAARAKVSEQEAGALPVAEAEKDGPFSRALAILRRIATGQQLAMSTVMLLVVAIGLWYLPARRRPNADGETVMAPQSGEETPGGAASSAPAAVELQRRDEASTPGPTPSAAAGGPKPAPRAPGAPRSTARRLEGAPFAAPPAERAGDALSAEAPSGAAPEELGRAGRPLSDALAETTEAAAPQPQRYSRAAEERAPIRSSGGAPAPSSPRRSAAPSAAPAASAPAYDHNLAGAPATDRSGPTGASAYERGLSAYRAGRYAEAARLFSAARSGPEAASSLHYLARSHRAAGQCAVAVRHYERLLGGFPTYGGRAQAMVEAAECYERTGHLAAAERWLERAAQASPSLVAARRGLARVRARRAAAAPHEANDPPAAESAPEEP